MLQEKAVILWQSLEKAHIPWLLASSLTFNTTHRRLFPHTAMICYFSINYSMLKYTLLVGKNLDDLENHSILRIYKKNINKIYNLDFLWYVAK